MPSEKQQVAAQLLDLTYAKLKQLELAVKTQQPDFASVRVADVLKGVSELELLEVSYCAEPGLLYCKIDSNIDMRTEPCTCYWM